MAGASMDGILPWLWWRDPRESPQTRLFLHGFHAAPPGTPREFSSYSKCRGQIDVVGATGLEPATPCSRK